MKNIQKIVVTKLNKELNIPFFNEKQEEQIFNTSVEYMLKFIDEKTHGALTVVDKVLEIEGVQKFVEFKIPEGITRYDLVKAINKEIDVPIIGEEKEENIIAFVVDIALDVFNIEL